MCQANEAVVLLGLKNTSWSNPVISPDYLPSEERFWFIYPCFSSAGTDPLRLRIDFSENTVARYIRLVYKTSLFIFILVFVIISEQLCFITDLPLIP